MDTAEYVTRSLPERDGKRPPDDLTLGELRAVIAARMQPMTLEDLSRAAAAEHARRRDVMARQPAGSNKLRQFSRGMAAWGHVCMVMGLIDGSADW